MTTTKQHVTHVHVVFTSPTGKELYEKRSEYDFIIIKPEVFEKRLDSEFIPQLIGYLTAQTLEEDDVKAPFQLYTKGDTIKFWVYVDNVKVWNDPELLQQEVNKYMGMIKERLEDTAIMKGVQLTTKDAIPFETFYGSWEQDYRKLNLAHAGKEEEQEIIS